jgi:hypothetical protein
MLASWDLGGEPPAWAYRHAGELFRATEIPPGDLHPGLVRASRATAVIAVLEAGFETVSM